LADTFIRSAIQSMLSVCVIAGN